MLVLGAAALTLIMAARRSDGQAGAKLDMPGTTILLGFPMPRLPVIALIFSDVDMSIITKVEYIKLA